MRTKWIAVVASAAALVCLAPLARSSDHQDGPQATTEITADITDLFTWMSADGSKVNFVLDVDPFAAPSNIFAIDVQYVIQVESRATLTGAAVTSTNIICTFDAPQKISCWVGASEYVTGDASVTTGITSASGKVRVFAGKRDDPAFFNRKGFTATATAIGTQFGGYPTDGAGCPIVPGANATATLNLLKSDGQGGAATDTFAKANVLALVLSVDKTLLSTAQAPILSVWASTRRRP